MTQVSAGLKTDSKIISKLFFSLLPVQILFVAIGSVNSVIDSVVASNVIGMEAMTVIGLFGPYMQFLETLNLVLLSCAQILCGQFLGKNQLERTSNIVEHGFGGKKSHSIDVRVVHKENQLMLRIKDDCRAFNPEEKMKLIDPDYITHNIGLRMVHSLAKETFYSNVLGLNIFTMTI